MKDSARKIDGTGKQTASCERCGGDRVVGVCTGKNAGTWMPCPKCAEAKREDWAKKMPGYHEGCNYLADKDGYCNKCGYMAPEAKACRPKDAGEREADLWRVLLACETDRQRLLGDGFLGDSISDRVQRVLGKRPDPAPSAAVPQSAVGCVWIGCGCEKIYGYLHGKFAVCEDHYRQFLSDLAATRPQQSSASPAEAPEGWLTAEEIETLRPLVRYDRPKEADLLCDMALAAIRQQDATTTGQEK